MFDNEFLAGDFCPKEICPDYDKLQGKAQQNIIRFGTTKAGRQRYKCKTCNGTFTERYSVDIKGF